MRLLTHMPPCRSRAGDPAITLPRMPVVEFHHPLQELLLPRSLLMGSIPAPRSRHLSNPADLPADTSWSSPFSRSRSFGFLASLTSIGPNCATTDGILPARGRGLGRHPRCSDRRLPDSGSGSSPLCCISFLSWSSGWLAPKTKTHPLTQITEVTSPSGNPARKARGGRSFSSK